MTDAPESNEEQVLQAALHWHAATSRVDCDWTAFTEWLEAHPTHRLAYDDVVLLNEVIARHRAVLRRSDAPPISHRRLWWAAAAAVLLLVATALFVSDIPLPFAAPPSRDYLAQGSSSLIGLADGSHVLLAPGSRLRVSGRHRDRLELLGAAYFDIVHDPDRSLVLNAGGLVVRDIGTRFEVFGSGHMAKVAVEEGVVSVGVLGQDAGTRVPAGHRLLAFGTPRVAEYASIGADDVAGWRSGRLVFRNEPLSLVAGQISLYAGMPVSVDPAIAARRFSGVLVIGDGSELVARLGEIMDLAVQHQGASLRLAAVGAEQPGR
jgi:transmembrane sensor